MINEPQHDDNQLTPVDDVRVVRDHRDEEFGGDLRKLAEHSRAVTDRLRAQLGLKSVPAPQARHGVAAQ